MPSGLELGVFGVKSVCLLRDQVKSHYPGQVCNGASHFGSGLK